MRPANTLAVAHTRWNFHQVLDLNAVQWWRCAYRFRNVLEKSSQVTRDALERGRVVSSKPPGASTEVGSAPRRVIG